MVGHLLAGHELTQATTLLQSSGVTHPTQCQMWREAALLAWKAQRAYPVLYGLVQGTELVQSPHDAYP